MRYSSWISFNSPKFLSKINSVKPIIWFNGVLISWLILARNWLLALLAASAAPFDICNSISVRFRSEISARNSSLAFAMSAVLSATLVSNSSLALCKAFSTRFRSFISTFSCLFAFVNSAVRSSTFCSRLEYISK